MLAEDELRDAVLLIFANKQDLPNAMNAAEITDKLGLHSLRNRNWYVFNFLPFARVFFLVVVFFFLLSFRASSLTSRHFELTVAPVLSAGISRRHVRHRAMASTRDWTGFRTSSRIRSENKRAKKKQREKKRKEKKSREKKQTKKNTNNNSNKAKRIENVEKAIGDDDDDGQT